MGPSIRLVFVFGGQMSYGIGRLPSALPSYTDSRPPLRRSGLFTGRRWSPFRVFGCNKF